MLHQINISLQVFFIVSHTQLYPPPLFGDRYYVLLIASGVAYAFRDSIYVFQLGIFGLGI